MFKIKISEEAENDIINSVDYYKSKQKGLGKRFFNLVLKSFETISENPFAFVKIDNNMRKYVMKKFPFIILYKISKTIILIIAVFHTSRNPSVIKKRYT